VVRDLVEAPVELGARIGHAHHATRRVRPVELEQRLAGATIAALLPPSSARRNAAIACSRSRSSARSIPVRCPFDQRSCRRSDR
jgi:hypothetical protein